MKTKSPTLFAPVVLGLGLMWSPILGSCAATAAVVSGTLMNMAQNMFGTAEANFTGAYPQDLQTLLGAMAQDAGVAGLTSGIPLAVLQQPITLDVGMLMETVVDGRSMPVPITNGAVLVDGRGDPDAGDNFKITFEASTDCHVYVLSIDGTGWATPIFPTGDDLGNPVAANRQYQIPGDEWFYLDQYRGIETIYFIASNAPRPDLEKQFAELAYLTRPELPAGAAQITEQAIIERGIGGRRQGKGATVLGSDGLTHTFNPTSFTSAQGASDLMITRWFSHQ